MKIVLKIGNDTGKTIDFWEEHKACDSLENGQFAQVVLQANQNGEFLIELHRCAEDPKRIDLAIYEGAKTEIQEIQFKEMEKNDFFIEEWDLQ